MLKSEITFTVTVPYETANINDEYFDTNRLIEVGRRAAVSAILKDAVIQLEEGKKDGTVPNDWRKE